MKYANMLSVVTALGLGAGVPMQATAEDWIFPCGAGQEYAAAGASDSAPATALERVCQAIGPRRISQSCLVYYTKKTGEWPVYSEADLAQDAAACEASMPGEISGGVVEALPDEPGDGGCGSSMVECVEPDQPVVPEDGPSAGLGGANQQTNVGGSVAPAVPPADPTALDLAFWNSVRDSGNPVLFQAYLDQFPQGVFAAIAREMLKQTTAGNGAGAAADNTGLQDPDGRTAFANAERIMAAAYDQDPSQWDAAGRRALPLYQAAADKGLAEAWLGLGDLHEMGVGTPEDVPAALAAFDRAGALGLAEGYERALYLRDQIADDAGFVADFLALYRGNPDSALGVLEGVSRARVQAVQTRLRDLGYYRGAIDGAFGAASNRALAAYISGAPVPTAPPVASPEPQAPAGDPLTAGIQRELTRVGCYHGAIDGRWGPQTAMAMQNFDDWAGFDAPFDGPTGAGLEMVSAAEGPLCGVD